MVCRCVTARAQAENQAYQHSNQHKWHYSLINAFCICHLMISRSMRLVCVIVIHLHFECHGKNLKNPILLTKNSDWFRQSTHSKMKWKNSNRLAFKTHTHWPFAARVAQWDRVHYVIQVMIIRSTLCRFCFASIHGQRIKTLTWFPFYFFSVNASTRLRPKTLSIE